MGELKSKQSVLLVVLSALAVFSILRVEGTVERDFEFLRAQKQPLFDGNEVTVFYRSTVIPTVIVTNMDGSLDFERAKVLDSFVQVKTSPSEPFLFLIFQLPTAMYGILFTLHSPAFQEEQLPNVYFNIQPGNTLNQVGNDISVREVTYATGSDAVFTLNYQKVYDSSRSVQQNEATYLYFDVKDGGDSGVSEVTLVEGEAGVSSGRLRVDNATYGAGRSAFVFRLPNPSGKDPKGALFFTESVDYDYRDISLVATLKAFILVPYYPSSLSSVFPPGEVSFVQREGETNPATQTCQAGQDCEISSCWAMGDNPGAVIFSRVGANGQLIPLDSYDVAVQGLVSFNRFSLKNISPNDAGEYACTTESAGGQIRKNIVIEVQN